MATATAPQLSGTDANRVRLYIDLSESDSDDNRVRLHFVPSQSDSDDTSVEYVRTKVKEMPAKSIAEQVAPFLITDSSDENVTHKRKDLESPITTKSKYPTLYACDCPFRWAWPAESEKYEECITKTAIVHLDAQGRSWTISSCTIARMSAVLITSRAENFGFRTPHPFFTADGVFASFISVNIPDGGPRQNEQIQRRIASSARNKYGLGSSTAKHDYLKLSTICNKLIEDYKSGGCQCEICERLVAAITKVALVC